MSGEYKIEVCWDKERKCWKASFCENHDCRGLGITPGEAVEGLLRISKDYEIYKIEHPIV